MRYDSVAWQQCFAGELQFPCRQFDFEKTLYYRATIDTSQRSWMIEFRTNALSELASFEHSPGAALSLPDFSLPSRELSCSLSA